MEERKMSCSYYENKGGSGFFGGFEPYCHKKGDYVNSDVYDKYCKSYSYDECPIYRGSASSGGCYLTSACMVSKCLPDDCYELETLRNYRDTWLKSTEEGLAVIAEYYAIAPKIVEAIDKREDSNSIYDMLYEQMVLPCVKFIEEKKYQETLELYRSLTLKLREEYW